MDLNVLDTIPKEVLVKYNRKLFQLIQLRQALDFAAPRAARLGSLVKNRGSEPISLGRWQGGSTAGTTAVRQGCSREFRLDTACLRNSTGMKASARPARGSSETVKLQGKVIEYHSLPSNAGAQASDLMPVFSCWFVLFLLV